MGVFSVISHRSYGSGGRAYGAAATAGLIALGLFVFCGDPAAAQTQIHVYNAKAQASQATNTLLRPPSILEVQPTAQEVEAAAEKESAKARVFGLEPDMWVAIFTLALTISTLLMWLETKRLAGGAEDQSVKMAASIGEAARAANAMECVSRSMAINADQIVQSVATSKEISARQQRFGEMQMRAYVTVLIGNALFQDGTGLKFQCDPVLINTGHTPAKSVTWRGRAAVLPRPLPAGFKFKLPPQRIGRTLLGPQQTGAMLFVVDDLVPAEDVDAIKAGVGQALYVWGVVTYEDVFKRKHRTVFAQQVYWTGPVEKQVIRGWHLNKHNRAS